MSRRPVNSGRRLLDSGPNLPVSSLHPKSRSSHLLSVGLLLLGAFFLIAYSYNEAGGFRANTGESSGREGVSCTSEVIQALPYLKKAYGSHMQKVLHIGPETCTIVSYLLGEGNVEAWGVEPYDIEDPDSICKNLVHKGFVRVADIKFSLPYKRNSFNFVIVSDALDYLTPRYLNKTLPDLARISANGIVIFAGHPGQQRAKVSEFPKFGRPAKMRSSSWWIRHFLQTGMEENEVAAKKFAQAASKKSFKPSCQIFHLIS